MGRGIFLSLRLSAIVEQYLCMVPINNHIFFDVRTSPTGIRKHARHAPDRWHELDCSITYCM